MKKRLLITSIVMMLVVAVALSTATYAWFTSNASVTASNISLTAATNGDAALGISYQDSGYTTTIAADNFAGAGLNPMAPASLNTSGDSITQSNVTFFTSKIKSTNGDFVFISPGTATPHTVTFTESDTIYIKNLSTANAISTPIPVTAAITDAKGWLRVGIFTKQGEETVFTLKGVFGVEYVKATGAYDSEAEYYTLNLTTHSYELVETNEESAFATYYVKQTGHAVRGAMPEAGSSVATFEATKYECVTTCNIASTLAAQEVMQVKVIVWTDGAALNDDTQGGEASVVLTFGTAA